MDIKSLKNCTDTEIRKKIDSAISEIRDSPSQYGVIKIEISGGKVKFITIEKPISANYTN